MRKYFLSNSEFKKHHREKLFADCVIDEIRLLVSEHGWKLDVEKNALTVGWANVYGSFCYSLNRRCFKIS